MTSFYYYDKNPSGYCFPVQMRAFAKTGEVERNYKMFANPVFINQGSFKIAKIAKIIKNKVYV